MRLAAAALACVLAATPAFGQSGGEAPEQAPDAGGAADIVGLWAFQTDLYENFRCQMTGELELAATADPNIYSGRLVAFESCDGQQLYEARQIVAAVRDGAVLTLESSLDEVLPSADFYAPDNFVLTIVNGALMVGELRSADVAPATFRRRDDLVS
jgi:hypothetical protein